MRGDFHHPRRNVLGVKGEFSGHHQAAAKFSKLGIVTFISYYHIIFIYLVVSGN